MAVRRDQTRATAVAAGVSAVLHLLLLALLARVVPVLRTPVYAPQPDMQVQLAPAPDASPIFTPFALSRRAGAAGQPAVRAPTSAPALRRSGPASLRALSAAPAPARSIPPPPRATPSILSPAPVAAPGRPSSPAPAAGGRGAASAAQGREAGPHGGRGGAGPLPGDEASGGVREFLRETVGCSHEDYVRLTAAERGECDRRVGYDARQIGAQRVDAVPLEKRAYYDAVQEAYRKLHDPAAPVPTGVGGSSYTAAGHPPGIGCKFGGTGKPPNSLKLGPLPCYVTPPQGVGTEESGIPKP